LANRREAGVTLVLVLPPDMTLKDWGTIAAVILITGLVVLRQLDQRRGTPGESGRD
jgi:hypothetical protein